MLRHLIDDLESALAAIRATDLLPGSRAARAPAPDDRASLSQWLPYRAYLEDRQVFVNRDALGFCLEVRPQSGSDEDMARVLTALYAASPAGTGLQFHLLASPDIRGTLARYADLRLPDPVVPELDALGRAGRHSNIHRSMARRRVGHYLAGAHHSLLPNQSYLFRNFRLILSVSLPGSPDNLSRIEELLLLRDGHRATLHAAGFPSRPWTAAELINWVSALVDPHRQGGEGLPLTYDPGRELRDQVIDRSTRLAVHQTGIELSNPAAAQSREMRLLSVRSFPPRFALWAMGSLIGDLYQATLQYPCPFMITLGVHVPGREATRNWAYLKAARATTNATSTMARFLPDMQERKADWDIVLKAMDDGQQLVDLQHQVALFAPLRDMARAEQSARSIFRARGFELSRDTMMMAQGLISRCR
jgi:conjugal transfer ATP-binding protein TraC